MKRIALFTLTVLLLAACNSGLTVADKDVLKTYPELEGTIWAWQSMVDSAAAEDCEGFLENMRITLNLTEEVCPAAFAYFEHFFSNNMYQSSHFFVQHPRRAEKLVSPNADGVYDTLHAGLK